MGHDGMYVLYVDKKICPLAKLVLVCIIRRYMYVVGCQYSHSSAKDNNYCASFFLIFFFSLPETSPPFFPFNYVASKCVKKLNER